MGYYISNIGEAKLNEYIGSNTIYSCANNGAFDGKVCDELEKLANEDVGIYAIVDEQGVNHFLNVLKNGNVVGRDVELMTKIIEENYQQGFMIRG